MLPNTSSNCNPELDASEELAVLEHGAAFGPVQRSGELGPPDHRIRRRETEALARGAEAVMKYSYITQPEKWVLASQLVAARLPVRLREELHGFRRFGNPAGGLLFRPLPLGDSIPRTPHVADNTRAPELLATGATSVLIAALGEQYGFMPELGGKLFQSILPMMGAEKSQRSVGSELYLLDHIEMAFTAFRADYVVLTCVRADHHGAAGTAVASIDNILPLLDARTRSILSEPRFRTTVDESFLIGWGETDKTIWVDPSSLRGDSSPTAHAGGLCRNRRHRQRSAGSTRDA